MPAPKRVNGRAVLTTVYLSEDVLKALHAIASAKAAREGRKVTVSEVIREALERYARDQTTALGLQLVLEQSPVGPASSGTKLEEDPLAIYRKMKAVQELQRFERALQRDIEAWEQLKPRVVGGYGHRVLPSDFFDFKKRVEDREKWFRRILRDHLRDLRDRDVISYANRVVSQLLQLQGELSGVVG